jgi:hypothetical protein
MPINPAQLLNAQQSAADEQLLKVASACEGYGVELALLKVAEMESKEEDKEDEEEDLSEEEKKEASAMGLYTLEGFIAKLAHAGEVMYGDPSVYIRALAEQNGSYEKVAAAEGMFRRGYNSAKEHIAKGWEHTKGFGKDVGGAYTNKGVWQNAGGARDHFVRATAAGLPSAAVGAAGGAAIDDENRVRGALIGAAGMGALGGTAGAFAPQIGAGARKGYDKVKGLFANGEKAAPAAKAKPKAKK